MPAIHSRVQDDGTFVYLYNNEGTVSTKTRKGNGTEPDYQTKYFWDYHNRLVGVQHFAGNGAGGVSTTKTLDEQYFYDAFDHRIGMNVVEDAATTFTYFGYQGDQLLLARNTAGAVTDRFLPGPLGRAIAQDAAMAEVIDGVTVPAGPRWLLADHEGSVRTVMSATGAVLGRVNYDSFGKVTSATTPAAAGSLFGYAGSVYDVATGLSFMNARYYDPASGRFLSEDPLGFAAGDMNVYRYVGNNPVNLVDPTGLEAGPAQKIGVTGNTGISTIWDYGGSGIVPGGGISQSYYRSGYGGANAYANLYGSSGGSHGSNSQFDSIDYINNLNVNLDESRSPGGNIWGPVPGTFANPTYAELSAAAELNDAIENTPVGYDPFRNPDAKFVSFDAHDYRARQIQEYGDSATGSFFTELAASISRFVTDEPRYADLETPGQRTANNIADFSGNGGLLALNAAAIGAVPKSAVVSRPASAAPSTLAQVTINRQAGLTFQQEVTSALGAQPAGRMTGTTLSGAPYTTIPDGILPSGGLLEAKAGQYISNSPQLQAQAWIGQQPGAMGSTLVVGPQSTVSNPVIRGFRHTPAMPQVFRFDPATGTIRPYQ